MSQIYFTTEHEWVSVDGNVGTVGITDYAQHALGDIVYVELPATGAKVAKGAEAAVVESVKAASDVYSPVSGDVASVNQSIVDQPALVNEAPEDGGWFFQVVLSDPAELGGLMDRAAYDAFVKGLE